MMGRRLPAVLAMCLLPSEAYADGAALNRRVAWHDWSWDPVILLNLSLILWLYCRGWSSLQQMRAATRRSGEAIRHGGIRGRWIDAPWRTAMFGAGMLVLLVSLISPLDPLAEQLGAAHMVQHMVLMTIAAPLLIAGGTGIICFRGLPPAARRAVGVLRRSVGHRGRRWFWSPLVVFGLYAIAMWVWHVPGLYGAALRNAFVHDLQHLTFFIAALLFWRLLLDPVSHWTLHGGLAVLYLFLTTLHATVLGVFMTLAPNPWYPEYIGRTERWGLTALEDQQLAGLIMWMPACAAYALVAIGLFAQALEDR